MVGRMHGMHVRPGQLLRQGLARLHHHSPAWPHRPIKTGLPLLFFPPISHSLFISHFFSRTPSPHPHKACSHIPLFPLCPSNCSGLKKKNEERGMTLGERDGEEERESEGKGGGAYHTTSEARTVCPDPPSPNSKNSTDQHVSTRVSNVLQHLNKSLQEQIRDVTYCPVRLLKQLQQSWSIKRGLYFCSAPQNYLIVDSQSTRSSKEGRFPNYVIAESDVSSLKWRFLRILTRTQSFLLD